MMELDKLTQIQKATINYNSSTLSLMKREYEKTRKEVYKHEHSTDKPKV